MQFGIFPNFLGALRAKIADILKDILDEAFNVHVFKLDAFILEKVKVERKNALARSA